MTPSFARHRPLRAGPDARPLLVIEQEPLAPAGHLIDWLDQRGIAYELVMASAGSSLPGPSPFSGIVALGSQCSAYDDHVPWVSDELKLLRSAVSAAVPVLGICFGGQALASALGARVSRAASSEIGWLGVGSRRAELIPDAPWFTWHEDVFALPDGATLLARNAECVQAFAHGPHVGLQFHPEVTPAIIESWLSLAAERGVIADAAAMAARTRVLYPAARAHAFQLFDAWYERSVAASAGVSASPA